MTKENSHIAEAALENIKPIKGSEIRTIRERANLSQAAFAGYFNRKRRYILQLERGATEPKGPALALLNVFKRKGFEVIL